MGKLTRQTIITKLSGLKVLSLRAVQGLVGSLEQALRTAEKLQEELP